MVDNPAKSIVKSRFECSEEDKSMFSKSTCVVLISIGQSAHENEKLHANIERCIQQFKFVTVAVCDSLQRHSIAIEENLKSNEAYLKSQKLGEDWINKYKNLLAKCNKGYFRWDKWLLRNDFDKNKRIIINEYNSDQTFKDSMDRTVKDYAARVIKRKKGLIDGSVIEQASLDYLTEECAIIMLMWQEESYNYIVYPSPILDIMNVTFNRFVVPKNKNLLKWTRIKLKTKQFRSKEIVTSNA